MGKFSLRNLAVLAYAQGFTLFHYKALDVPLAVLLEPPAFFSPARDLLADGDMIIISAADGGAIRIATSSGSFVSLAAPA